MGIITSFYKKTILNRMDDNHVNYYLQVSDFDNLIEEKVKFQNEDGLNLSGAFYYKDNYDDSKLIVFSHGMGPGYRAYMREIDTLCNLGYKVFAYDAIGTGDSEGESIYTFTQSLKSLNNALDYLKNNNYSLNKRIILIGHSWGAFAVSNIGNYRNDFDSVIAISGFVNLKQLMKQFFKGPLSIFVNSIIKYEKKLSPKYYNSSSIESLSNTDKKVLIIHSKDDNMVNYSNNFELLKNSINNEYVEFMSVENKRHNPNYTVDAVNYMNEVFSTMHTKIKNKEIKSDDDKREYLKNINVDWFRMTEQDMDIYKKIKTVIDGE